MNSNHLQSASHFITSGENPRAITIFEQACYESVVLVSTGDLKIAVFGASSETDASETAAAYLKGEKVIATETIDYKKCILRTLLNDIFEPHGGTIEDNSSDYIDVCFYPKGFGSDGEARCERVVAVLCDEKPSFYGLANHIEPDGTYTREKSIDIKFSEEILPSDSIGEQMEKAKRMALQVFGEIIKDREEMRGLETKQ